MGRFRSIVFALALTAGIAQARPGGGESYSGGGGYSGASGGFSGGGTAVNYAGANHTIPGYDPHAPDGNQSNPLPWLGVMAVLFFTGVWMIRRKPRYLELEEAEAATRREPLRAAPASLGKLQGIDPGFSLVVFEDFAFRLFSAAQRVRSDCATVAPYIGPVARRALARRAPRNTTVAQVVVGALRTFHFELGSARIRIGVEFEANVATSDHTYFSVERWWFSRSAGTYSKPPGAAQRFPCPNCGAPWKADHSGTQICASCEHVVDNGRFDWVVDDIEIVTLDERPPTLTTDRTERSVELASIRQVDVRERWRDFAADEPKPAKAKAALLARLETIYSELNRAWSNGDLTPARGVVTDGLYDYLQYWIAAYRQQGLANRLADMRIERIEITKVEFDRYFDAVTVRIFATGKDVTIRTATGARVVGSADHDRPYSEYWTLIRATAHGGDGPEPAPSCSHCGAPLSDGHAGACGHCGSFVISSRRDWILAKIEQADTFHRRAISSAP